MKNEWTTREIFGDRDYISAKRCYSKSTRAYKINAISGHDTPLFKYTCPKCNVVFKRPYNPDLAAFVKMCHACGLTFIAYVK